MREQAGRLSVVMLAVVTGSLFISLFLGEPWLWMDEITSSILLADSSVSHMNRALVSGLDSHPPLFFNLYWWLGHAVSLNPLFLKSVSIAFFGGAVTLFYRFTTRLVGRPTTGFLLFTLLICLTYLNYKLATQIRTYSVYLFSSCLYFIVIHRLIQSPASPIWLVGCLLTGLALLFVNNFGSFYVVASGVFFGALWLWSRQKHYGLVVLLHLAVVGIWWLVWYPNAQIQAEAGNPHSWIPVPTFWSSFQTLGELLPAFPSRLEHRLGFGWLSLLRVVLVAGLFGYLAVPKLSAGFGAFRADRAFSMYVLSGGLMLLTAGALLVVSLTYMSVFISRCLWPSHLLLLYQAAYAGQCIPDTLKNRWRPQVARLMPVYVLVLGGFMVYQSQKVALFPGAIKPYLSRLDGRYPVFFESADYFLPVWYYGPVRAFYLLDWPTADHKGNMLNATVDYNILRSLRDEYGVAGVVPPDQFNQRRFPHFYVVDEASRYQIEWFIANRRVRVVRSIPVAINGHRILECAFSN